MWSSPPSTRMASPSPAGPVGDDRAAIGVTAMTAAVGAVAAVAGEVWGGAIATEAAIANGDKTATATATATAIATVIADVTVTLDRAPFRVPSTTSPCSRVRVSADVSPREMQRPMRSSAIAPVGARGTEAEVPAKGNRVAVAGHSRNAVAPRSAEIGVDPRSSAETREALPRSAVVVGRSRGEVVPLSAAIAVVVVSPVAEDLPPIAFPTTSPSGRARARIPTSIDH